MKESQSEASRDCLPLFKFVSKLKCVVTLGVLLLGLGRVEGAALDTSSPVNFFTGTANLLLQSAGYNFTVTNIPIYPTNYYTPALHRLLQVAANLYDSTTNRAFSDGTSPNGPFFPAVFRPTFDRSGSNIFVSGYVEEGEGTQSYNVIPLSLPRDADLVSATTTNIYGIPWVIGARKGFPNFNEVSLACVVQVTRKVAVTNLNPGFATPMFQTNVQYIVGISNVIGVEAWNSYSNSYPRAIDLIGVDNLSMELTNESGVLYAVDGNGSGGQGWRYTIDSNGWVGAKLNSVHIYNTNSLQVPLLTNVIFLPDMVYSPQVPHFGFSTNFENNAFTVPQFVLNATNTLRFIMLDHLTGRVIDYVQLDGMNFRRNIADELPGSDGGGSGGVWLTNGTGGGPLRGIMNQIEISEGLPVQGFTTSQWPANSLPGASHQDAIAAFDQFLSHGDEGTNSFQAPFTPTRKIVTVYKWQVNDPLVHYTLSDLSSGVIGVQFITNYLNVGLLTYATNYLPTIGQANLIYRPWNDLGTPNGIKSDPNVTIVANVAYKDPLATNSDGWNFPVGQAVTLASLAGVHRGTPWQTVYLKSAPVTLANWESWTGDMNDADALLLEPTNDWGIVRVLLPLIAPARDPHLTYGFNHADAGAWGPVFQGLTILTNAGNKLTSGVIDSVTNGNAIAQMVAGINAQRMITQGRVFTNAVSLLAVPQLSVASPFLGADPTKGILSDAAYEALPVQLLPLVRPDWIGSVARTNGMMEVQFTGLDGYSYVVEGSTNLQDWAPLATVEATNGVFGFAEAGSFGRRYYRTVLAR